ANRRAEAVKQFAIFGVTPEMIFHVLEVKGIEDITIEHLVTLKGILTAIKEGDTTAEQIFSAPMGQSSNSMGSATAAKASDLDNKYRTRSEGQNVAASSSANPPMALGAEVKPLESSQINAQPRKEEHRRTQ